jgi:hypothetical protein
MAEKKTELDIGVNDSLGDVEFNAAPAALATEESPNSQTLDVGLCEMISRWSDSVH